MPGAIARSVLWVVLLVAVAGIYVGCGDEVGRYKVLTFFFDGVPPPPGVTPINPPEVVGPYGTRVPESEVAAQGAAAQRLATRPETPLPVFEHAPYKQRQCFRCHTPEKSYEVPIASVDLCRKCHPAHYEYEPTDWVHGPSTTGQCSICHKPHESNYPHLLTKPELDLCWSCHDANDVMTRPYHEEAQKRPCTGCHDPHFAGNHLLLADSRTYQREKIFVTGAASSHTAWSPADCRRCHVPERSNAVLPGVNAVCVTCHDKVLKPAPGVRLHNPVRQEECVTCHTPHKSPLPHLIRPAAEAICYTCHTPKDIQTPEHPQVFRVDCLLCHRGHSSERPHLLEADIPFGPPGGGQPKPKPSGSQETKPSPGAGGATGRSDG